MEKRPYNKKSSYWKQFEKEQIESKAAETPDFEYQHISIANSPSVSNSSTPSIRGSRNRAAPVRNTVEDKYELLSKEFLPYENHGGDVTISEAIELSQKAAASVPIVRNTIEVMTEFSTTKLHVYSKNNKAKAFIEAWLEKINIRKIQEQFFREYYRSGNVFFYRFDGVFDKKDQEAVRDIFGAKTLNDIPLRYVLLNPINIGVESGLVPSDGEYVKILSPFEVSRLKNPTSKLEKDIYNGLSQENKDILKKANLNEITIKLDMARLRYVFYKKQDYEPLALPMLYPILSDIEHKLQLKRVDRILAKTVDNIILLITMGNEPDKGGINTNNLKRVQELLLNPAFGRTLVSDYTTKAQFIIPDLEKILGPEKYEQVDKDIKEGLQNATLGEDRFADTFVKVKVFIERLRDGQEVFLTEFLMPEIKRVAAQMGFRDIPEVVPEKISLHDPNVFNKTVIRMVELGILVPDEAFKVMESGLFPEKDSNIKDQKEFKLLKDQGLYDPLIGGKNQSDGRPEGTTGTPRDSNTPGVQVQATDYNEFTRTVDDSNKLIQKAAQLLKKHGNKKRLTPSLKSLADSIAMDVICNTPKERWEETLEKCILTKTPAPMTEVTSAIMDLADEYGVETDKASLIYHSQEK